MAKKIGKNEIIDLIYSDKDASGFNFTKTDINKILDIFAKIVRKHVARNIKVSVYGLGVFWKSSIKGRTGVNPQTGEKIKISKKTVPRFTASKTFKEWR